MMKRKGNINVMSLLLMTFLILGTTSAFLLAQEGHGKGRLQGVVVDEKDTPVANVTVTIMFGSNEATKRTVKTDSKGEWAFVGLGTGKWQIIATLEGFVPAQKNQQVNQLTRNPIVTLVMKKPESVKPKVSKDSNFIQDADTFFKEGKFNEALELYQKVSASRPEIYQTYFYIGNCYKGLGEYDKAIAEYQKGIEKIPNDKDNISNKAKALAEIGDTYVKKGDQKTAQDYFKKSVELNPKDEILAYNVAEIYYGNNQTDEAIKYYNLALEIKPKWHYIYLKLGYAYLNKGDIKTAIENMEKFVKLDPDHEEAGSANEVIKSLKQ